MNRQQEYWDLVRELDHTPEALDGTAQRAKARAKRRRAGKRWGISLGSAAGVCAAFVIAVNTLPTFALACGKIPVLRELAAAVAFSPSLSAAVEHDYVQYVGQSQTAGGLTLTLEYVIADAQQMVVFYRVDGGESSDYSATCTLKDETGTPLTGYSVGSTSTAEALKRFEVHLKELAELPTQLTLEVELCGFDSEGNRNPVEHVFPFTIALDPTKTAPAVEIPVGEWVELDGQRLLVDRLELTPTKTTLYLEDDPDNTAWLEHLDFHFTGGDGTVYETADASLTASGRPEGEGFYTYYFQSLYFVEDRSHLTLHLDGAIWLDKAAEPVTVDLTGGVHTGALPESVTGLWVRRADIVELGEQWVVTVIAAANRSPFELEYRDPEGGVHNTNGYSMMDDRDGSDRYEFEYFLTDYPWETAVFTLNYTSVSELSQPISVPLG